MQFKQTVFIGMIAVFLLPFIARAQSVVLDSHKLSQNELGGTITIGHLEDVTSLSGRLSYGINKDTKGFLSGGLIFADDDELKAFGESIPPSPLFNIGMLTTKPFGKSGLEYISQGAFSVVFARVIDDITNDTILKSRGLSLSGGLGLLKRIKTASELIITPSFMLFVNTGWITSESNEFNNETETESDTSFSGQIGLEIGVSPTFSIGSGVGFSFEDSDLVFSISASFYPQSAK